MTNVAFEGLWEILYHYLYEGLQITSHIFTVILTVEIIHYCHMDVVEGD